MGRRSPLFAAFVLLGCGGGSGDAPSDATAEGATQDAARDSTTIGDDGGAQDGADIIDAAPPDSEADATTARCSGKTAVRRGLTNRTKTVSGADRTYLVYLPQALDPNEPAPLVFVHHGYLMSGQTMYDITGFAALADREKIALAFPDGEAGPNSPGAPWNVGTGVCGAGALSQASGDDFGFLEAMRKDIENDQCIDAAHVFVTGFSMGGYFANHVGCMRPDLARAIAPHSGGTHDFSACAPGKKPVILFHGSADGVIVPSCGTQARDLWATKNGCDGGVTTTAVDGGACEYSNGCPDGGQVALCMFNGLQHAWAGGAPNHAFSDPSYASATELEWGFFKKYAW